MKQYIKKALWIIAIFFSVSTKAATFVYQGTGGTSYTSAATGAATPSNWKNGGTSATAADFTNSANSFDVNGRYCEIGGLTIGAVTFFNSSTSGAPGVVVGSNKTLTISSASPPSFNSTTAGGIAAMKIELDRYSNSTIKYSYSAGTQTLLSGLFYKRLQLTGGDKQISSLYLEGTLTCTTALNLIIVDQLYIFGGAILSITNNNFKFTLLNSTNSINYGTYFDDDNGHGNQSYPGTWEFKDVNNTGVINPGEYYNVIISSNCKLQNFDTITYTRSSRGVKTSIINNLEMSANKTLELREQILEIQGSVTNTNGLSGGKIIGDLHCSIISTGDATLYFDQTSNTTKSVNDINVSSGGTFSLGNNVIVDSLLNLDAGFLNINDNTFTINGSINNPNNNGYFKGSSTSSLICGATGTLYFNQSGTDSVLRNLTINNSKTVELGNDLKIAGGTNFGIVEVASGATLKTNGYLTLRSYADGSPKTVGSAAIGNSPGTITGTIHVETFLPATAGRRYRFLASPVTGATATHWRENGNNNQYKGIQITGTSGSSKGFDPSKTNNPSAFYFNENNAANEVSIGAGANDDGGWTAFSSGSEPLTNGTGYRVFVRGDRSIDLTGSGGSTTPIDTRIKVSGSYAGSSVNIPVTNSGSNSNNGINLVGNPYPSTIDWDNVSRSNVDPAYVIYRPAANSYGYYTSGSSGTVSRYISSGQGFLVYCTNSGTKSTPGTGSITISESSKTNVAGGQYFTEIKKNHLMIQMTYDSSYWDNTIVYFKSGATRTYDQFDAGHILNNGVNLASLDSTGNRYGVNTQDSLFGTRIIPLSIQGTAAGDFKIHFEDVNTFADHEVYLVDNYLKKTIKVEDFSPINISINAEELSFKDSRFQIVFAPKNNVSINKIAVNSNYSVGPIPVTDKLIVTNKKNLHSKIEYTIINISGQKIQEGTANELGQINTSYLPSGIYYINLSNSTESATIKFIK